MKLRIIFIFLLSFILQLIVIFALKIPLEQDAIMYDRVAVYLTQKITHTAAGLEDIEQGFKQGFVAFLALVYLIFGHSVLAAKIIQAIFMSLTCIIVYRIGKDLFNQRVGFYSAIFSVFHPGLFIVSSHLISESMFTFLFACAVFFLVMAMKKSSLKYYFISAVFLTISMQFRLTPVLLPLLIILGLFIFYRSKLYAFKATLVFISTIIILGALFNIRNYILYGRSFNPFLIDGGAGVLWVSSFSEGNADQDNPKLKDELSKFTKSIYIYSLEKGMDNREFHAERQRILFKMAINNIKDHPFRYISFFPKKIIKLWVGSYSGLYRTNIPFSSFLKDINIIKEYRFVLFWKLFVLAFSVGIFLFGIIGMVLCRKNWKKLLPIYSVLFYFTLLHMVFISETRLSIPALPYLIIFACVPLVRLSRDSIYD